MIRIVCFVLLCASYMQVSAQTVVWQDSLSIATVYLHIDKTDYKEHPHRTSSKFDVIETQAEKRPEILRIVNKALRKYSPKVLNDNVEKLYVYDQFDKGDDWMGTYLGRHGFFFKVTYLENGEVDTTTFERVIHHEISHRLFMFNLKHFDKKGWKANSALKYGKIKSYNRDFNPDLYEKGFLHKYAVLNRLEDFSAFAENIFMPITPFWEAIEKHDRLKKKFEIVCRFYEALDPAMNETYFRKFGVN